MIKKIVYIWIDNYHNVLVDTGINFGSNYIYNTHIDDETLTLNYSKNESYIENFFNTDGQCGIADLTAIVGKNGSGKSLFCNLMRSIVSNGNPLTHFLLICEEEDENGNEFYSARNFTEYDLDIKGNDNLNFKISGKETGNVFDGISYAGGWHCLPDSESIFYSPIVDYSNVEILSRYPDGIDVSTNYQSFHDIEKNDSRNGFKSTDFLTIPRAENFKRQFKMIHEFRSLELPSGVKIHSDDIFIRLVYLDTDLSIISRSDYGWNIPLNFHTPLKKIAEKHKEEVRALNRVRSNLSQGVKRGDPSILDIDREIYVLDFALNALKCFIYNLNKDNGHLDSNWNINDKEYDKLNLLESINFFFENQAIIEKTSLNLAIDVIKDNKEYIRFVDWTSDNKEIILPFDTTITMFSIYLSIYSEFRLNHVGGHYEDGASFLEFDWNVNLSSGEKSFIDLFSRLYYAKEVLEKKLEKKDSNEWPSLLFLVLDEAEMGFHPQWQKEYIKYLLNNVPNIFARVDNKGQLLWSNIQILLTSHSPFPLSDIPINHVNFFDKKEVGINQWKVESSYGSEIGMNETFGANIHELYTESFFLNNGFMGEFAVDKINTIINAIRSESTLSEDTQVYIKKVINLIGEPLIKQRLSEMFNDKYRSKEELAIEIKRLTDQYNNLDEEN